MKSSTRRVAPDPTRAFQPSADRASLWLVGQYDDALRMLRGAVLGRQGVHVLVGEPGTGKTVLAHALAVRVRQDNVVIGRLLYPIVEGMDLRATIAEAFNLPAEFKDGDEFVERFGRFIDDTTRAGRRVLLIVDQAQHLTRDVIVELRRLVYGRPPGDAASLSVLLVGYRALLDTLRADGIEPDVLCDLRPLTREQTVEYVAHRLRAAGHRRQLFTPPALRKIWVVSEGIPRVVNRMCIEALSGRATSARKVTASLVDRPARESEPVADSEAPAVAHDVPPVVQVSRIRPRPRWLSLAGGGGVAIAATLFASLIFTSSDQAPWVSPQPAPTTASTIPEDTTRGTAPVSSTDTEASSVAAAPSTEPAPPAAITPVETPAVAAVAPVPVVAPAPVVPPVAPVVKTPPKIPAAAPPRAPRVVTSAPQRSDDADDSVAMIDWLLKERRIGTGTPLERVQ